MEGCNPTAKSHGVIRDVCKGRVTWIKGQTKIADEFHASALLITVSPTLLNEDIANCLIGTRDNGRGEQRHGKRSCEAGVGDALKGG